jgi:hypothetical protein
MTGAKSWQSPRMRENMNSIDLQQKNLAKSSRCPKSYEAKKVERYSV